STKVKRAVIGVSRSRSKTLPIASFAPSEGPRKVIIPKRQISLDDDPRAMGKFLEASKIKIEKERREQEIRTERTERRRLAQLQLEMRKEAERLEKLRLAWRERVERVILEATELAETTSQLVQEAAQDRLAILRAKSARRVQPLESSLDHLRDEIVLTRIDTAGRKLFLTQ